MSMTMFKNSFVSSWKCWSEITYSKAMHIMGKEKGTEKEIERKTERASKRERDREREGGERKR